jgi:hypothetical protein
MMTLVRTRAPSVRPANLALNSGRKQLDEKDLGRRPRSRSRPLGLMLNSESNKR